MKLKPINKQTPDARHASNLKRALVAVSVAQAISLPTAQAATILVNDFSDAAPATGICTLRQAIVSANTNAAVGGCTSGGAGNDQIRFESFESQTINLTQGSPLAITEDLEILGRRHAAITVNGSANGNNSNFTIGNGANVTLDRLTISGATLTQPFSKGAGVNATSAGAVTVSNSNVSSNVLSADQSTGAGIYIGNSVSLAIINSAINANSAAANFSAGGGIAVVDTHLTIQNSTVSNNSALDSAGILISGGSVTASISNSTITGNSAAAAAGGMGLISGPTLSIERSIVSGNLSGLNDGTEIRDFQGAAMVSSSNSLFADNGKTTSEASPVGFTPGMSDINASSDGARPTALSSILNTNLESNGGQTLSHNLVANSPALGQTACLGEDQRRQPRTGPMCDMGAIEFTPLSQTITVDTIADGASGCSLRSALQAAKQNIPINSCDAGGVSDTILFAPAVFPNNASQTISLSSGLPTIDSNVTIRGKPGLTIDGNQQARVFDIVRSKVSLNQLIITGGSQSGYGGGVAANFEADVTIANSTIHSNTANNYGGGGVAMSNRARIRLLDSSLSNNQSSEYGGGAYVQSSGRFEAQRSTIAGNTANFSGGVEVQSGASALLLNTTVSSNSGTFGGGGIGVSRLGRIDINNSTISNNFAPTGMFALYGGIANVANSIIAGNNNFELVQSGTGVINVENSVLGDSSENSALSFFQVSPGTSNFIAASDSPSSTALSAILEPLADNGGPTLTHALSANSPAINAGNTANCPATDQRGEHRDNRCDYGAYEFIEEESCFVVKAANGKVMTFCL